jgi:hypothetical protein
LASIIEHDLDATPKTSRRVRDYGKNKSPTTRRHYNTIAKGYANLEFELAAKNDEINVLKAEVARLTKTRKRRAIPNPNKKFIPLSEGLAGENQAPEKQEVVEQPIVEEDDEEDDNKDDENDDNEYEDDAPVRRTRSGRAIKKPRMY